MPAFNTLAIYCYKHHYTSLCADTCTATLFCTILDLHRQQASSNFVIASLISANMRQFYPYTTRSVL